MATKLPESNLMSLQAPQLGLIPQPVFQGQTGPNALQLAGKTLSDTADIGAAFQNAERVADFTRAKTGLFVQKTKFLTDLENDPEGIDNPSVLGAKWGEFKKNVADGFQTKYGQDPNMLEALGNSMARDFAVTDAAVSGLYRRRVVDKGRAATEGELNAYLQTLPSAIGDENAVAGIEMNARRSVELGVKAGFLTADQGGDMLRKFLGQKDEFAARRDISQDPGLAIASLSDPQKYANLNPIRRTELFHAAQVQEEHRLNMLDRQEARAERNLRLYQSKNEDQAFADALEKKLTVQDVVSGLRTQRYSKSGAATLLAVMERGDRADMQTPDTVIRLAEIDNLEELNESFNAGEINATLYRQRRKELQSEENVDYRDAKDLLSKVFKQGEIFRDPDMEKRHALALLQVQNIYHDPAGGGTAARAKAIEMMRREATNVAAPDGYVGPVTLEGLEDFKRRAVEEYERGAKTEKDKRRLNRLINTANTSITRLGTLQAMLAGED